MFEQQINVIKFYQNRLNIECNLLMPYNHIKLNILFGFRPSNVQFKMLNMFRLKIQFRNHFCQASERVRKEESKSAKGREIVTKNLDLMMKIMNLKLEKKTKREMCEWWNALKIPLTTLLPGNSAKNLESLLRGYNNYYAHLTVSVLMEQR